MLRLFYSSSRGRVDQGDELVAFAGNRRLGTKPRCGV